MRNENGDKIEDWESEQTGWGSEDPKSKEGLGLDPRWKETSFEDCLGLGWFGLVELECRSRRVLGQGTVNDAIFTLYQCFLVLGFGELVMSVLFKWEMWAARSMREEIWRSKTKMGLFLYFYFYLVIWVLWGVFDVYDASKVHNK